MFSGGEIGHGRVNSEPGADALLGFIHRHSHGGPPAPAVSGSFAQAYKSLVGRGLIAFDDQAKIWFVTKTGEQLLPQGSGLDFCARTAGRGAQWAPRQARKQVPTEGNILQYKGYDISTMTLHAKGPAVFETAYIVRRGETVVRRGTVRGPFYSEGAAHFAAETGACEWIDQYVGARAQQGGRGGKLAR